MDDKATTAEGIIVNMAGEQVALGPLCRDHLPVWYRGFNDFEVSAYAGYMGIRPMTWEALEEWYEDMSRPRSEHRIWFTIYERVTLAPVGLTHLRDINYRHRTAEFAIVIMDRQYWGKGYGTEATILMLDWGFTALGLHNILLSTLGANERALGAYRRAGFREIGRRREAERVGGRLYDTVYMDCLATEFKSPFEPVVELP